MIAAIRGCDNCNWEIWEQLKGVWVLSDSKYISYHINQKLNYNKKHITIII